jgi:hypothetical protein
MMVDGPLYTLQVWAAIGLALYASDQYLNFSQRRPRGGRE